MYVKRPYQRVAPDIDAWDEVYSDPFIEYDPWGYRNQMPEPGLTVRGSAPGYAPPMLPVAEYTQPMDVTPAMAEYTQPTNVMPALACPAPVGATDTTTKTSISGMELLKLGGVIGVTLFALFIVYKYMAQDDLREKERLMREAYLKRIRLPAGFIERY